MRIAATQGALDGANALARNNACNQANDLTVTVPAELSGTAVLQWYWDGDAPYYDCADITVSRAAGGANSANRDGATSSDIDCDGDECAGSGGKIFVALLLVLVILGGVHYCKDTSGAKEPPIPGPPPPIPAIPQRGGAPPPAIPQRPAIPPRGPPIPRRP